MKKLFLLGIMCLITCVSFAAGPKTKTNYRNALVYAYSQASWEDENVKLEIYNQKLWITNKTEKTIFIDLSQCFLIHNGNSKPMFSSDKNKKGDEKKASKKGVATSVDEFITVAPKLGSKKQNETFIVDMGTGIFGKYSTSETPDGEFSEYDSRLFETVNDLLQESLDADPKHKEYIGTASKDLLEDESINNIGATIAYAFTKKSEDWKTVVISSWVSNVTFAPIYMEYPTGLSKKDKKGFGVKLSKPGIIHIKADSPFEFEQDKMPLIVAEWEGNFKKGTFELKSTYIDDIKWIINYDGASAEWGKMSYADYLDETSQTK